MLGGDAMKSKVESLSGSVNLYVIYLGRQIDFRILVLSLGSRLQISRDVTAGGDGVRAVSVCVYTCQVTVGGGVSSMWMCMKLKRREMNKVNVYFTLQT